MTRRVLFVNVTFPPQSRGGASRVIEDDIACMLADDGYTPCGVFCTLVGSNTADRHETWLHRGVPVFAAACPWLNDMEQLVSRPDLVGPFVQFLDRVQPDLVHFHCIQRMGLELVQAVKDRGIPMVLTMHDGWWVADDLFMLDSNLDLSVYDYKAKSPEVARNRMAALGRAISLFDKVLTVSVKFRDILLATGICEHIIANENGVSPLPTLPKSRSDAVRLLYMGGIDARKGFHLLRAAVLDAQLANTQITIIDHSRRQGFSRRGHWGQTEINTIGYVPASDVPSLYAGADVVVVPSLWPESFNLVAREASQAGCWVLASSLGAAAADIVPGVNGFTFGTDSADELIGLLRMLDSDPDRFTRPPGPVALRSVAEQYQELRQIYDEVFFGR